MKQRSEYISEVQQTDALLFAGSKRNYVVNSILTLGNNLVERFHRDDKSKLIVFLFY